MNWKKISIVAASLVILWASFAGAQSGQSDPRSAYSYVRESTGDVTVVSEANGSVEARRNLPISSGDSLSTVDSARAEVALADGNVLQVGGGSQIKFVSLSDQQGSDEEVSALDLSEGSVILVSVGNDDRSVPRIDTDDATIYAGLGSRVRVNFDSRRGTAVIVRAGSVEVRTPAGSYTVRAGNYLTVHGDEEPEIARGDFSHDRFDGWAAERLEQTSQATRSASSRYVGDDYAGDAQSMDGYGDWDYNDTYSANVWRPRVEAGWSPYSNGSWYYTPAGLTWWSADPWGWYPFHYGNWFFDAGWNSWCWSPGYLYSPAWVYWGFSGSYLGWCPVGWYGGYSPWWNNYYRNWGFPRNGVCFALNGHFSTRRVDLRGWNFTGAGNVGGRGRMDVVPGSRVGGRLGNDFSVSSRPIVVPARSGVSVRDSLREQIREIPRTIERTSGRDSERLAPIMARDAKLPSSSVDALRERAVVAERGRLTGTAASEIAPRGARIVERNPELAGSGSVRRDERAGRSVITNRGQDSAERGRPAAVPNREDRSGRSPNTNRSDSSDAWRGRSQAPGTAEPDRNRETRAPEARSAKPANQERADAWRQSTRPAPSRPAPSREENVQRGGQSWRSRSDVPPARRVIEGAVPGRRAPEAGRNDNWRQAPPSREAQPREAPRSRDWAPRDRDTAPPPRDRGNAPPSYRNAPPPRDFAPRDRPEAPPSYRSAPPPRDFAPRSAPPPSRSFERAPAPPAPRSAPNPPSSRSSPPPQSHGRNGRN